MAIALEFQLQRQFFQWLFRIDSFKIDWFDLFAVQSTLKSLLQHHSSKGSILQHSTFFMVQLSHPYMTTGKTMSSVQFSGSSCPNLCSLMEGQHARPPCPSSAPRACSNSCPSSQWCHPNMSSPVIPLSSCLQSFPASGSFLMSQFFPSGGQSIGVSSSAWVLPMNIQD